MLVALAMMLTVYLATFETTTIVVFPSILLLIGLGMEMWLEKKREYVDHFAEEKTMKTIGYWTIVALLGFFLTGYMVQHVNLTILTGWASAISFTVLMAIAEEQFFRGFITDMFLTNFKYSMLALGGSAFVFMFYHYARYGTDPNSMLYVFAGGFILNWVAYKSRRISPCMLAHIINNVVAVVG